MTIKEYVNMELSQKSTIKFCCDRISQKKANELESELSCRITELRVSKNNIGIYLAQRLKSRREVQDARD